MIPLGIIGNILNITALPFSGSQGGGGTTPVLKDSDLTDNTSYNTFGDVAHMYTYSSFIAANTYTLTSFKVKAYTGVSPTGIITGYVYNDNGTGFYPSTSPMATSTNTVNGTSLTITPTFIEFDFSGVSISSGTKYHLVISYSTPTSLQNISFRENDSSTGNWIGYGSDGINWTVDVGNAQFVFETYGF